MDLTHQHILVSFFADDVAAVVEVVRQVAQYIADYLWYVVEPGNGDILFERDELRTLAEVLIDGILLESLVDIGAFLLRDLFTHFRVPYIVYHCEDSFSLHLCLLSFESVILHEAI